jgi:hypothetical protein
METSVDSEFLSVRSLERWNVDAFHYPDISSYANTQNRSKGVHTIVENGVPIDVYEDLVPGTPLVIFLNGAARRGPDIKLPIFSGFGVVPAGNLSRVCISDPVLYENEDLTLGWYSGSSRVKAQTLLPAVLKSIIEQARPSRVIFVGGSGGGFACLYYSRLIENSIAVVWNPQTDITRYVALSVAAYARIGFGLNDHNQLPSVIETNVAHLYAHSFVNRVVYLQNSSDWHVKSHLAPFLSAQGFPVPDVFESRAYSDRFYLHMGNWGDGHQQPPQAFLKAILAKLMDSERSVPELFAADVMQSIMTAGDAAIEKTTAV